MNGHNLQDSDFIIIAQSEAINYQEYSRLPLDRLPLYQKLVYPRMVYYRGGFRSHLNILNELEHGVFWENETPETRRSLYSIWNLPGFVGTHLANYLSPHNIKTYVINNIDAEWDVFCAQYEAARRKPLIGLSTTFHLSWSESVRLIKRIHRAYPEAEVVLGGAFVNGEVKHKGVEAVAQVAKKHGMNYIVHSFNSEQDIKNLIQAWKTGSDIALVKNLIYLEKTGPGIPAVKHTPVCWHQSVLNEQPLSWNDLDIPASQTILQIRTSAGCPFACAFCSYPETAGGFFTMDIEAVDRQLDSIFKNKNIRNIIFIDDTFNVPAKRFKALCQIFHKYDFNWFSFLRVQFVDEDVATLMHQSGCRAVYLGIESANNQLLQNMNKKATRDDFARGMACLKKHDIAVMAAFVLGFPGETDESILDNINFIESQGIDFYTLKEFYYLPDTPVHRQRHKYELVGQGADWSHATMNSQRAYEKKIEMFTRITKSCFIDPDTSLWTLAYLYDRGFSISDIHQIQLSINRLMSRQIAGQFDDADPEFSHLKAKLALHQKVTPCKM